VVAAETTEEARRLFTPHQQAFVNLRRGTPGPLPPPDTKAIEALSPHERWELDQTLSASIVGSFGEVRSGLEAFIGKTAADEVIVVAQIHDHAARLRSYELTANVRESLATRTA